MSIDARFNNETIFELRKKEWNEETIKNKIDEIFQNISILPTWKFIKSEWTTPKPKRKEEIKKHYFKVLKVYLNEYTKKGTVKKEHVYNFQVPMLVKDQFFFIGGNYKIPVFQLYDNHIITREQSTKKLYKFKNNAISIICNVSKKNNIKTNIHINHMKLNRNIPLEYIVAAMYTEKEFDNFISELPQTNTTLNNLIEKVKELWANHKKTELYELLGHYRSSLVSRTDDCKKGESIVFSIKHAYDLDIFTKKFMKTDSIIFELLEAINSNKDTGINLTEKRIRFSEYILSELVKQIYDMIGTLNYSKKVKYKISQSILLDACNVSTIVHFNSNYNPLGEISSLLQCTLIGPNSFKKGTVPNHLRDLHESQFGYICPADTPDRDGCGVIYNMVPSVDIDEDGRFGEKSEIPCSYPITLVPFMQNDDQTRLQMASGQMKQSIMLDNADTPMVKTGSESNYIEYTTFQNRAKMDGVVIHLDNKFIVVEYDDKSHEVFNLGYRPLYVNTTDYIYTKLQENDTFVKNDIITQSNFIKNNDIVYGKNLLTAIMIWKGFNYEDGIVINEKVCDKFTSIHTTNFTFEIEPGHILLSLEDDHYNPLPKVGDLISQGSVYAKIKHMYEEGYESLNIEPRELISPYDCIVTNIEIYPNTWNKQVPQFNHYINEMIDEQNERIRSLRNKLEGNMTPTEITELITTNNLSQLEYDPKKNMKYKYTDKGNNIKGVQIKIEAIYKERMQVGDKFANRHGNKGIVAKIIPDEEMPTLEDGRKAEILINPLGLISRMNIGQLYEIATTQSLHDFKNKLHEVNKSGKYKLLKDMLNEYLLLFDKTDNKWPTKEILNQFKIDYKHDKEQAIENINLIQPIFKSISPDDLFKIMEYTNSKFKFNIHDCEENKPIKNKIACGYMYWQKLVHRSSDKMISRSIGPYSNSTLQPLAGKKKKGGHRFGEMEVWALLANGAEDTLREMMTIHSDSPSLKNKELSKILQNLELIENDTSDSKPRTLQLLESYLNILGITIED